MTDGATRGSRLLELVAVMDRLRSPGGCPWDAEQTHESLVRYLLEEAYETVEAIESGDAAHLREELGDLLLQVVFHARIGEEDSEAPWSVDDVAGGIVDKLVHRHPHVFGDRSVHSAAEVEANWDALKAAEKGRTSVTDGVPLAQPALTLAATLQRKAARAGMPADLVAGEVSAVDTPARAVMGALAAAEETPGVDAIGDLLFTAVAFARAHDVDPEAALRGRARDFRDALREVEETTRAEGRAIADLDAEGWRERWPQP